MLQLVAEALQSDWPLLCSPELPDVQPANMKPQQGEKNIKKRPCS